MNPQVTEQILAAVTNSDSAKAALAILLLPTNILEVNVVDTPASSANTKAEITVKSGMKYTYQYNRENIKSVIDAVLGEDIISIFSNSTEVDIINFLNKAGLNIDDEDINVTIIAGKAVNISTTNKSIRFNGEANYNLTINEETGIPTVNSVKYHVSTRKLTASVLNAKDAEVVVTLPETVIEHVPVVKGKINLTIDTELNKNDLISVSVGSSNVDLNVPEHDSYGIYFSNIRVNLKTRAITGNVSGVGSVKIEHPKLPANINATMFGLDAHFVYYIPESVTNLVVGDKIKFIAADKVFEYELKEADMNTDVPPQTEFIDSITYNPATREVSVAVRGITSVNITYPNIGAEDITVVDGTAVGISPRPISNGDVIIVTGGTQTLTKQVSATVSLTNLVVNVATKKITANTTGTSSVVYTNPDNVSITIAVDVNGDVNWNLPDVEYEVNDTFRLAATADVTKFMEYSLVEGDLPANALPIISDFGIETNGGYIWGTVRSDLEWVDVTDERGNVMRIGNNGGIWSQQFQEWAVNYGSVLQLTASNGETDTYTHTPEQNVTINITGINAAENKVSVEVISDVAFTLASMVNGAVLNYSIAVGTNNINATYMDGDIGSVMLITSPYARNYVTITE